MCFGVRLSGDVRWSGGEARRLASVPGATWRSELGDAHAGVSCRVQLGAPYNSALRLVLGYAEDFAEAGEAVLGELEAGLA